MDRKGNVLAIMSAKGGTGKTSTTANLALALSNEFNKKILAIDTNISTASLAIHFGLDFENKTIYDVLSFNYPIEATITKYNENLHIIPASLKVFNLKENEKNLFLISDKIKKLADHYDILLSQLVKKYDLVILDSAPGFSYESLATMKIADGVLFVTNPDYPSLIATTKAVAYAKKMEVPMGGLVLTKITNKNYELSVNQIEKLVGAQIIAEIPEDKNLPESIAKGIPLVNYKTHSQASISYKELAGRLVGEKYDKTLLESLKTLF